MAIEQTHDRDRRRQLSNRPPVTQNGHELLRIAEILPGREPTDYNIELTEGPSYDYQTKYWQCRKCGQERNHREEFRTECAIETLPDPVTEGGYSVENARTRRALTETMEIHYGSQGPVYEVHSGSGSIYEIDIEEEQCSCPDHSKRGTFCKHLRRVDLEIRSGTVPDPDGTFTR